MKEKLNLTKEEAFLIIDGDNDNFEIVKDEIYDHSRWSVHHEVIIRRKSDNKYFKDCYSVGATESQDESPWEYDPPNFIEVEKKEKVVYVYE